MKFDFLTDDCSYLPLTTRKEAFEYYTFSLSSSKGLKKFCFLKDDFSFYEHGATEEDFKHLLSFNQGQEIVEQLKTIVKEVEKFKHSEKINFFIYDEKEWDGTFFFYLRIENSPLHINYNFHLYKIGNNITFTLDGSYEQKCAMFLSFDDSNFFKKAAFDFVQKNSKHRLRLLTKNAN